MPKGAVWVGCQSARECEVGAVPLGKRRATNHCRADKWMTELDGRRVHANETALDAWGQDVDGDGSPEQLRRGREDLRDTGPVVERGDQQGSAGICREVGLASGKAQFQTLRQRQCGGERTAGPCDGLRQLEESEWIAGGLAQDSSAHFRAKTR